MRIVFKIITPLFIAIACAGCGKQEKTEAESPRDAGPQDLVKLSSQSVQEIGLQTESIGLKLFSKEVAIPARVLADQDNEAQVGSLVNGRVYKVFVKVGDQIKAGQDLMLVEGLEIGEIKAKFLTAKANMEYQKANLERQKKLLDENVGSQKAYLEAQNEYEKSRAEYSAEVNRIKTIHLSEKDIVNKENAGMNGQDFGTIPVKSPIDGIVVERNVVLGQSIDESTVAFKIVNLNSVWVDGQIYEKDLDRISANTQVTFTSPAYPDLSFTGKISYVGQTMDEKTRTITIRAVFSNVNHKLKPQMFGELKIPSAKKEALVVPAEALAKIDNADYVFLKNDGEAYKKTPVTVGLVNKEYVEIKNGLKSGDVVVVKGSSYLKAELLKASFSEEE